MKKYILTIVGDFESEELCKDMAYTLTPLVDSPTLKFSHSKRVCLMHFASEVSKEEIFDFITGVFFGISETFILTEYHDKLTVALPDVVKEHLLNLEENSGGGNNSLNMSFVKSNFDFDLGKDDEDFVALVLEQTKNIIKRPTLDQILDKMLSKGYESLSQFEKDTLELYSKN